MINTRLTPFKTFTFCLVMLLGSLEVYAQGCMPAKHIPPNIGTRGLSYLVDGQWEAGLSYRFLRSNYLFEGSEKLINLTKSDLGPDMYGHTINLFGRYSMNHRLSFSVNVPLMSIQESFPHDDGVRYVDKTGVQLGDIRISANYWIKDPLDGGNGNVALGLGFKLPTGNNRLQGFWHDSNGIPAQRDLDIAQQPGDGGFGIILDAYWIQNISEILSAYGSGFYLINPRNMSDSPQPSWIPYSDPSSTFASVPDQFGARAGLTLTKSNFAFGAGLQYVGMPVNDLIGDSDGFRRPGNILYFEPSIIWSDIINTINVSVPLALFREIKTSNYDASLGVPTAGGLADFLILIGYTRRF